MSGYELINYQCVPQCTYPAVRKNGECVVQCSGNTRYDTNKQKCVCTDGFVDDGYGNCKPNCPSYSAYDPISKKCICNDGYTKD